MNEAEVREAVKVCKRKIVNIDAQRGKMKKYQIIYADPPWSYKVWSAKGGHKSASAHYKVMDEQDISKLPVYELSDTNCILFMWATYPNLQEAFKVMQSWGFQYKTVGFTWVKMYSNGNPVCGLGYYTRANAEICMIGVRGKPKRVNKGVYQAILAPQREHSRKPDEIRDRIVTLMGDLPRIELFARQKTEGWDVWGNEVESDIILVPKS
jgi:N6-adenosine-specific RNA methylase IME4